MTEISYSERHLSYSEQMHHGAEFTVVFLFCFTLVSGAALRILCPKLKLPYTIGVMLLGLASGMLFGHERGPLGLLEAGSRIGHELILFVFLPALVFESAFSLKVHAFRKDIRPILILAGPVLLVCAIAQGLFMVVLTNSSWQWDLVTCLTFGALISATDPVAVVALLKELGAPKRLGLLLEGESLFNDGTSIVVFGVLLDALISHHPFEVAQTLSHFLVVTAGGFGAGLLIAGLCSLWMGRVFNDPLVEITITLVMAYATMLIVEGLLHLSGVMAVVAAGLWLSGPGRTSISPEVEHFLHRFWEMLSYLANTLIFFLVGLVIAAQGQRLGLTELGIILSTYLALMVIRGVVILGSRPVLGTARYPVSQGESWVMAWGGLRGAVSLALALVVNQHEALPVALREQFLLVTAGVVFLTIMVNGTSLSSLLRRFRLDRPSAGTRLAELSSRLAVLKQVRDQVRHASGQRDLRTVMWSEVDTELKREVTQTEQLIDSTRSEVRLQDAGEEARAFWRQAMNVERQAFWKAYGQGCLGARTVHILDQEVDARLDLLETEGAAIRPASAPLPQQLLLQRLSRLGGPLDWLKFEALALRHDLARGETLAAEAVLRWLRGVQMGESVREAITGSYRALQKRGRETLEDLRFNLPEVTRAIETRLARRVLLNLERSAYQGLVHSGVIDPSTGRDEIADIEQQMKRLSRRRERLELPETAELVREARLFSDLKEEEWENLAVITKERALSPGEVLFSEGDLGDSLYIVARGAVLVYQQNTLVDILGGGELFGEVALLTGAPRSCSIQAATTVTLGEITRADFERLLSSSPGLRERTWETLARRHFEDVVRHDEAYEHLGHRARLSWFETGEHKQLSEGDTLQVEDQQPFLAVGCAETGGQRYQGPTFLPSKATFEIKAHSWVVLLSVLSPKPNDAEV